ncbi:MAG: helix-turn-helix domain-containing protein [Dehalococcoidia bacterium]
MELLTVNEAAREAGITPDHMRRLLNSRKVYGLKHGQTWIITRDEVLKFERSARGRPSKSGS